MTWQLGGEAATATAAAAAAAAAAATAVVLQQQPTACTHSLITKLQRELWAVKDSLKVT
jgi:hypothetical protein